MQSGNAPIFIVGCSHSGTTLLLNILGSHSKIHAISQETAFAFKWSEPCEEAKEFFSICDSDAANEGKCRWAEKTPSHILRIPTILNFFPDGKIIIMIRDGRDVAYSLNERFGDWVGIDQWVLDNREGQKFWNHSNVHCVQYETLITAPKETLVKVMNFLGEEFEEMQLLYHQKPKYYCADKIERQPRPDGEYHSLHRNWQINQPIFDGRGKWLRLNIADKQLIKEKAGDLLIELNYTSDLNW